MLESYGGLQILIHTPGSRVAQHYKILKFNIIGRGRGGCRRGRGCGGRGYGRAHGHGRGVQGGCGGRSYGHNPYELSSGYVTFMAESRLYPADQCRLLSS